MGHSGFLRKRGLLGSCFSFLIFHPFPKCQGNGPEGSSFQASYPPFKGPVEILHEEELQRNKQKKGEMGFFQLKEKHRKLVLNCYLPFLNHPASVFLNEETEKMCSLPSRHPGAAGQASAAAELRCLFPVFRDYLLLPSTALARRGHG